MAAAAAAPQAGARKRARDEAPRPARRDAGASPAAGKERAARQHPAAGQQAAAGQSGAQHRSHKGAAARASNKRAKPAGKEGGFAEVAAASSPWSGGAGGGTEAPPAKKSKLDSAADAEAPRKTAPAVSGVDSNWKQLLASGAVKRKPVNRHEAKRRAEAAAAHKSSSEAASARPAFPVIDWTRRQALPEPRSASGASAAAAAAAPGSAAYLRNVVAVDCEMVGVGPADESRLARVCVVNGVGQVLLDSYSKPREAVTNYRTQFSGIRAVDLVGAPSFYAVQSRVADLLRGRLVVGHSLRNDFEALEIKHPATLKRDTALYAPLRRANATGLGRTHSAKLKDLAISELGKLIQEGEHDPYVDARAALELYKKHCVAWERHVRLARQNRRAERASKRHRGGTADAAEDAAAAPAAAAASAAGAAAAPVAAAGGLAAAAARLAAPEQTVAGDIFARSKRPASKGRPHNRN
jgi:RNA exonuclease 4